MWTLVRRDEAMGEWRVVCPVHGELARYRNFWVASRDARQHDKNCGHEEAGPDAAEGLAARPGAG